jgi:ABC-type sugar transport system substrate-binding protein
MAVAAAGAVVSALTVEEGRVGDILVVGFMGFAAGLWISQSVHSLGNSYTDDDYKGVLMYLMEKL